MSEPKVIYLGPACEAETGDGRTWAEDNPWPDCECGHRPVQYVLGETFDRVVAERDALQLRLNAADQRIDELTQQHPEDGQLLIEDHRQFIAGEYEDLVDQASDFQDRAYALGIVRGKLKAAAAIIGIERMPPMEYDEP
ncbi:hypothetical protein [Pseudomonas sp. GM60]|uniref:hypothetical protein n=1 Tax=Pseudomonas sp. GM60 TaxID=1144334 RepID=UPI000270CCFA|nr:hypothetical protein [Pseudomonas sp. GM60]EJM73116.1 hypothetical protein PMI32_05810 [Pseudomonas sp. GM60]